MNATTNDRPRLDAQHNPDPAAWSERWTVLAGIMDGFESLTCAMQGVLVGESLATNIVHPADEADTIGRARLCLALHRIHGVQK